MIKFDDLSVENRRFVKSIPEGFKFGIPVKLLNGTYYPINHEKLFLRYYVSHSGYVFDVLEQSVKKHLLSEVINFYSTEDNELIRMSLQEVFWRTFCRFPEGKDDEFDSKGKFKPHFIEDENEGDGYFISGVKFKRPQFPVNSKIYEELITKDKMKIAISENGAIYHLKHKSFTMIHLDDEGYPFIYSKSGIKFRINEIIAYSWYPEIYDASIYSLMTTMCSEIFISKNTLLIYREDRNDIFKIADTGHCLQNLALVSYNTNWERKLESIEHFNIPINGFYNKWRMSKLGTIKSASRRIVNPFKIIYNEQTSEIIDVYYKLPESKKIFSIIDIFLWTMYRLTRDSISVLWSSFILSSEGIPVLDDIIIVTKSPMKEITGDVEGFCIGNEQFRNINNYKNIYYNHYISKHGAIFYTLYPQGFITYNVSSIDNGHKISIPYGNDVAWINLKSSMIYSWVSKKTPHRSKLTSINGIPTDISLSNLGIRSNLQESEMKDQIPEIIL